MNKKVFSLVAIALIILSISDPVNLTSNSINGKTKENKFEFIFKEKSDKFVFIYQNKYFEEKMPLSSYKKADDLYIYLRSFVRLSNGSIAWNKKERLLSVTISSKPFVADFNFLTLLVKNNEGKSAILKEKFEVLKDKTGTSHLFVSLNFIKDYYGGDLKREKDKNQQIVYVFKYFPETIVNDALSNEIVITSFYIFPQRIISLAPNITETLFALGFDAEIVGVTDFCDYPENAKNKTKIGGFSTPSLEKIFALKPDLVLASRGNPLDLIIKLKSLGIKVAAFDPKKLKEIIDFIESVSILTGKSAEGLILKHNLEKKWENVKQIKKTFKNKPKIYLEIWDNPYMSGNKNTFLGNLIEETGGINIANDALFEWPILQEEFILKENPDIIIVANHVKVEDVLKRKGWSTIPAVLEKRVYSIFPDLILRPSSRLFEGLEIIQEYIKKFNENKR